MVHIQGGKKILKKKKKKAIQKKKTIWSIPWQSGG